MRLNKTYAINQTMKYIIRSTKSNNEIVVSATGHRQHHHSSTTLTGLKTSDHNRLRTFAVGDDTLDNLYVVLPSKIALDLEGWELEQTIFDKCKKEHGSVTFDGVEYAIHDDAQIDNVGTGVAFFANGFSRQQLADYANEYGCGQEDIDLLFATHIKIRWNCDEWYASDDNDDQGAACDWACPESYKIIN